MCVQVSCPKTMKLLSNGNCESCPPQHIQTEDMKSCVPNGCKPNEIFVTNKCVQCPEYSQPNKDKYSCEFPNCGPLDKITKAGACEKCPE